MKLTSIILLSVAVTLVGCDDGRFAHDVSVLNVASNFSLRGDVLAPMDVSTITRGDGELGIIASDEGAVIQVISFSGNRREADILTNHALADPDDLEIDFEASAFMDGWFYVTGSHGLAKNKGTYQESRYRMFRFRLEDDGRLSNLEATTLTKIFEEEPILALNHRKPLQQKGVNIEGLAARDGALFVGFRSPNLDGNALVLRINADAVFTSEAPPYELLIVPIGPGLGIRGMTTFRDGFLMIAGNAGSENNKDFPTTADYIEGRPSELFFWRPLTNEVVHVGRFPANGKGKEEGVLTIAEGGDDSDAEIVIVYDSIPNGGATIFNIAPSVSSL